MNKASPTWYTWSLPVFWFCCFTYLYQQNLWIGTFLVSTLSPELFCLNIKDTDSARISKVSIFFFCASWIYTIYLEYISNIRKKNLCWLWLSLPLTFRHKVWGNGAVNIRTVFGEDIICGDMGCHRMEDKLLFRIIMYPRGIWDTSSSSNS